MNVWLVLWAETRLKVYECHPSDQRCVTFQDLKERDETHLKNEAGDRSCGVFSKEACEKGGEVGIPAD